MMVSWVPTGYLTERSKTVEPLLSGPLLSAQPIFGGPTSFPLHLFDKLKTEPRPTLFSGEPILSGQLSYTPMWPLNRSSTVLVFN